MVTDQPVHVPDRPRWLCYADGLPWPCDEGRDELARAHDRIGLAMYMGERMVDAARDMPTIQPDDLFERFLAWTRPAWM